LAIRRNIDIMRPILIGFVTFISAVSLIVSIPFAQTDPTMADLDQTIQYLLDHVAKSDVTFIRNGKSYQPQKAADHMKAKADHYKKEIKTPEDFIRLAGSKSRISGQVYLVKTKEGKEIPCADWLTKILNDYVKRQKESKRG
jgi:hypothetical protein